MIAASATADARVPINTTVGADVVETLAAVRGANLLPDDGRSGVCATGASPQPVAFRSDRIVLRTASKDAAALVALVAAGATLADPGWSAAPTDVRFVAPGGSAAGPPIVPVAVVSLATPAVRSEQVLGLVRALRGLGVVASPDYALAPSGGPLGMWPFGAPDPTDEPRPAARRARIGAGVTIALFDTGVPAAAEGTAPANLDELSDLDKPDHDGNRIVDLPYGGHTLAVASVIDTLAPGARVVAYRILDENVATDVTATERISEAMQEYELPDERWPDIILAPFGTPACDGLPPLGLQMIAETVAAQGRSLIVASAGNRSTDRPFYPAAFDGVLAVGSLDLTTDRDGSAWTSPDRAGPRSAFSNHGRWVDAWAGGEQLVTEHLTGLAFSDVGPVLQGRAVVSGTSFAAPVVAALLAEGVALTGRSAAWVWRRLLRPTGLACPASGGGVAVALTSMRAPFVAPPRHGRTSPC